MSFCDVRYGDKSDNKSYDVNDKENVDELHDE